MSESRVRLLRLHDHTGWAVLYDDAEIGRVRSFRTLNRGNRKVVTRWAYEGDPCEDAFETRTLAIAALIADRVRS